MIRRSIKKILKEQDENFEQKFLKSATKFRWILESQVDQNLITDISLENVKYDQKYNEISGDLLITSWCEDPDLFMYIEQLKRVDKELDKVLLNYSFKEDGTFGKNIGKYNNIMWYVFACNWNIDNGYEIKIKYHFRQEEYDED